MALCGMAAPAVRAAAVGEQASVLPESALHGAPGVEELYLEVALNRAPVEGLGHFFRSHGRLYADARTLHAIGLKWPEHAPADALVALDSLPGLHDEYDVREQRVRITAPVDLLTRPTEAVGYVAPSPPRVDPSTRAPGLLLNYDLYAQAGDGYRSVSGWNELRLFGAGPGVWRTSGIARASRDANGNQDHGWVRLDTSWELDFPGSMVSLVVGDTYSDALDWTRATRFGGIRVSSNFSLQPYRVTVPLASYAGEATLPSTVDMFIDGIRQSQQAVLPGRFQVNGTPMLNGTGNAQVVITDITGQSRVVDFSLYNDPRLLQAGLSDWSFEAGKVRRDYGLRSFSYAADPMASGSFRHGASNYLTLEAHGETTRGLAMGGAGALVRLGAAGGALHASYALSRHDGKAGHRQGLGYTWQGGLFSLRLSTLRGDADFRDVASLDGTPLPRRTDQAFVGLNLSHSQLGASYLRQDMPGGSRARYGSLSWSRATRGRGNFSLSLGRDLSGGTGSFAYLHWSLPLDERRQAWVGAQRRGGSDSATAGIMQSLPGDEDGWGWRVQAGTGDPSSGQAELSQLTRYGTWQAGVQQWRSNGEASTVAYANAAGGLLLMEGHLFAMRQVNDAFALVSTDGIADVPVLLENRPVGTTDRNGLLLLTPLNAWQDNKVSIDPLALPADVSIDHTHMDVVPETASGALARFPMRAIVAVEFGLRGPDGQWVPAGTPVRVEAAPAAGAETTVGYEGRVYLQDPPPGARLEVSMDAGTCTVVLPGSLPDRGWVNLGDLSCR